ncbi:MAG: hypothetical protein EOM58_11010, partial [Clostridia bacterium]|nr:hypothetical protein [Clostridia bacterium]
MVYKSLTEVMAEAYDSGHLFEHYSWQWLVVFAAIILYGVLTLVANNILAARPYRIFRAQAVIQQRIPCLILWAVFIIGSLGIAYLMLVHRYGVHLRTPWLRWMIFLPWLFIIAVVLPLSKNQKEPKHTAALIQLLIVSLIFFSLFSVFSRLARVTDYPFMLSWSEGNRFYDYSLIFASDLYHAASSLDTPYFSPGRYGLWGMLFLIRDLPIDLHRAWDALLWGLTPFLFSFAAAQRIRPGWLRWTVVLWGGLFLMQGPTYPMILIAGTLVLLVQNRTPLKKALPVALGSFYAAVSRWTWMLCGAYWAGLVELFDTYPRRKGSLLKRIQPMLISAGIGLAAGILAYFLFFYNSATVDLPLNQPLLLYRLFPNKTYHPGIMLGTFYAAGPAVILLAWYALSGRWKMDALQG